MLAYIDKVFKEEGTKRLGADVMEKLTDAQIEEARCYAFHVLNERTKMYGRQEKGLTENIFCRKVQRMLGMEVTL